MSTALHGRRQAFRENWLTLNIYERFEEVIAQVLTLVKVVAEGKKIIQVKTVLLIAVLALARKFIILDTHEYSAATILALAAVVIALGVTYWLIRERDARQAAELAALRSPR